MSNTPETEVLRISGNVTVPFDGNLTFRNAFARFCNDNGYHFIGNTVPQDDESGMRLYRVEEVEGYKTSLDKAEKVLSDLISAGNENDKAFKSLSEELAQEREKNKLLIDGINLTQKTIGVQGSSIILLRSTIEALKKRLELTENTRWRTFIKWWNNLWHQYKK